MRVLEADPELGHRVDPADRPAAARDSLARVVRAWQAEDVTRHLPGRGGLGLLVLDGVLAAESSLEGQGGEWVGLLAAGDLVRRWPEDPEGVAVDVRRGWHVVEPVTFAVLDRRFAQAIARWPAVTEALLDRFALRLRALSFHLAVCQVRRIDVRVLVMLWYLAERWGRVRADRVHIPVPVTHELLARIVGAHRPSVSTAVARLSERGLVSHRPGGGWSLHGSPPSVLTDLEQQLDDDRDAA